MSQYLKWYHICFSSLLALPCPTCYIFLWKPQLDTLISQIYFLNKILHVSDSFSVHHQIYFWNKTLHVSDSSSVHHQIYFWNKTLHVSDSSSVHYQEFFTVHTAMVYVIHVCWQLTSRIRKEFHSDPAPKLLANLCDIYYCCVYSEKLLMMDRGTVRNMQSFTPKINLRN